MNLGMILGKNLRIILEKILGIIIRMISAPQIKFIDLLASFRGLFAKAF